MRIDLITLGCSKNLVDTELVMKQLELCGYEVVHDSDNPMGEIVVINTCAFIGDAKEESIEMILDFAEAKSKGRIQKLFVMGCLSQRYLEDLKIELPEVDKFYGKFNYRELVADLGHLYSNDHSLERIITTPAHYAYVKISEGCNRLCSYCAIPIITGKHKSRPIEEIVSEVEWLVSQGVKEFQVIAQDLTYYGKDLYKTSKLAELLGRISDVEGVEWIRLHYAYPTNFPYDILPLMRERKNICKYLDIALQHVSDRMLKLMRRGLDKEETYQLLNRIREEVPGIHIRTTLMVGHPGEQETDFEELCQFAKDMRFERMGAFAYSHEDGTYCHKNYQDDVDPNVKQERLSVLMDIQQQIAAEINQQKEGKIYKVIVDRQEGDYFIARTEFDSPEVDGEVLISAVDNQLNIGDFYTVKIDKVDTFDLYASLV